MKKIIAFSLVLMLVLTFFAGCDQNPTADSGAKKQDTISGQKPPADSSGAQLPAQPKEPETPSDSNALPKTNPPSDNKISIENAKSIALKRAGLSANDVVFEKTELDFDDGIWKYEIEFRQGITEYDVDVKADDGQILYFEKDID